MAEAKGQIFPMDQHRFSYNECSYSVLGDQMHICSLRR